MGDSLNTSNSSKEQEIMQTARQLFWKHGISRIKVKEICEESGVSKMTFYRLFDNKIDLAKRVLEKEFREGVTAYRAIMDQDIPYPEKVKQMLHLKFEQVKNMSHELIADIYKNGGPEIMQLMSQKQMEGMQMALTDFMQAQNEGWIRPDVKPEFILFMMSKLIEFETDPALVAIYPNPQDMAVGLIQFFFHGILTHKE